MEGWGRAGQVGPGREGWWRGRCEVTTTAMMRCKAVNKKRWSCSVAPRRLPDIFSASVLRRLSTGACSNMWMSMADLMIGGLAA
eukprot:7322576-Pyramimonas_sp.AAC.1